MGIEGFTSFKIIQILKVNEYSSLEVMCKGRLLCDQREIGSPELFCLKYSEWSYTLLRKCVEMLSLSISHPQLRKTNVYKISFPASEEW